MKYRAMLKEIAARPHRALRVDPLSAGDLRRRSEIMGQQAIHDIGRALTAEYEGCSDREAARALDLRCARSLAMRAWCYALDATGYREQSCRCLCGGDSR